MFQIYRCRLNFINVTLVSDDNKYIFRYSMWYVGVFNNVTLLSDDYEYFRFLNCLKWIPQMRISSLTRRGTGVSKRFLLLRGKRSPLTEKMATSREDFFCTMTPQKVSAFLFYCACVSVNQI